MSIPALETFKLEYETSRECLAELRKQLGAELAMVNDAIAIARPKRGLGISDHAVLRYMERVRGIDTEAIRSEIQEAVASGQQIAPDAIAGNKREAYILSGGQVVTVLPAGSSAKVMRRRAA
jgi:hypothetical protein